MSRIVLVAGSQSYRTSDYLDAARLLRADVVVAGDATSPAVAVDRAIIVDLANVAESAATIASAAPDAAAVVAVDDEGVVIAAEAARRLGLRHNSPAAAAATRNKLAMRKLMAEHGVRQPLFDAAAPGELRGKAARIGYPVVVKPLTLSASRGVIRVNTAEAAAAAEARIRAILSRAGCDPDEPLLVEEYVPGDELAVEGLLVDGRLEVLAIIDKPEPMSGPFFAETLFVTPSRLPVAAQREVVSLVEDAVVALGLEVGPVHAEVRLPPEGPPQLIEVAARTIGGLCGRALTFGLVGESLETIVLRSAMGLPTVDTTSAIPSSGVLMLPVLERGELTGVDGIEDARAVPGVTDVTLTISPGSSIEPLPEGDRYLGFVFAVGETPRDVEDALRTAGSRLRLTIDGEDHGPLL